MAMTWRGNQPVADSSGLSNALFNYAQLENQEKQQAFQKDLAMREQQQNLINNYFKAREQFGDVDFDSFMTEMGKAPPTFQSNAAAVAPQEKGFFRSIGEKIGFLDPAKEDQPSVIDGAEAAAKEAPSGLSKLFAPTGSRLGTADLQRRQLLLAEAKEGKNISDADIEAFGLKGKVTPDAFKDVSDLARQDKQFTRAYRQAQIGNLNSRAESYVDPITRMQQRADIAELKKIEGEKRKAVESVKQLLPAGYELADPDKLVPTADDAKKIKDTVISGKNVVAGISDLKGLVNKHGVILGVPGKATDDFIRTTRGVQLKLKELENLGVLNGPDLKILEDSIGTIMGPKAKYLGQEAVMDTLKQVENKINREIENSATVRGYKRSATKLDPLKQEAKNKLLNALKARQATAQ